MKQLMPATTERAFQIADEQMFVVSRSYGMKADNESKYYYPTDVYGQEEFEEAVEWLTARGLAVRGRDAKGDYVRLLDPGAEAFKRAVEGPRPGGSSG